MTDPTEILTQGLALLREGRTAEAEALFRQALDAEPGNSDAQYLLGIIAFESGRAEEAGRLIGDSTHNNPSNPDAYVYLGHLAKQGGDLNLAEAHYRRAVELAPEYPLALNNLGNALRENKRIDEALGAYERAIEVDPAYVSALTNLGNLHRDEGDYGQAERFLRRAMEHAPNDVGIITYLARAVMRQDRAEEALRIYSDALRIDPRHADANADMAKIRALQGKPQEALIFCQAAIATDPAHTAGLSMLAHMSSETGDEETARRLLDGDRLVRMVDMQVPDEFNGLDAFNESLAGHLLAHLTLKLEPPGWATRNCYQSGNLLADPKGPMVHLEKIIRSAIATYAESLPDDPDHPFLVNRPSHWRLNVWGIVIDRAQGIVDSHNHAKSWLSGVCYIELPTDIDSAAADHAGWIEFGRAPLEFKCAIEPPITVIKPKKGKVLLFPAYFYHRTLPYDSGERRISIAFDVQVGD